MFLSRRSTGLNSAFTSTTNSIITERILKIEKLKPFGSNPSGKFTHIQVNKSLLCSWEIRSGKDLGLLVNSLD